MTRKIQVALLPALAAEQRGTSQLFWQDNSMIFKSGLAVFAYKCRQAWGMYRLCSQLEGACVSQRWLARRVPASREQTSHIPAPRLSRVHEERISIDPYPLFLYQHIFNSSRFEHHIISQPTQAGTDSIVAIVLMVNHHDIQLFCLATDLTVETC